MMKVVEHWKFYEGMEIMGSVGRRKG